jgi:hypothetical protein
MCIFVFVGDRFCKLLKSQSCTVSRPSVVTQHLSAAHLAFAEVLGHSAADLGEGGSHDFSEVSLWIWLVKCRLEGYVEM